MKFDSSTGQLIPTNTPKISIDLWRKQSNEKWLITLLLFPFRMAFVIFRLIYNFFLFIFKNFLAIIFKTVTYSTYIVAVLPFRILVWILTLGRKTIMKDWLESLIMKIDFWKHRGFIN